MKTLMSVDDLIDLLSACTESNVLYMYIYIRTYSIRMYSQHIKNPTESNVLHVHIVYVCTGNTYTHIYAACTLRIRMYRHIHTHIRCMYTSYTYDVCTGYDVYMSTMCTCMYRHTHTYVYMYVQAYAHIYIYIHTHTHTHTHPTPTHIRISMSTMCTCMYRQHIHTHIRISIYVCTANCG